MDTPINYLKKELDDLIMRDSYAVDFIHDFAVDGFWYWDLLHREENWISPGFWVTLGYDPSEMPHKSIAWKNIIHPEDLKIVFANLNKHLLNPEHPFDQVVRYTHKEGHITWIRCRGWAIRDKNGVPKRLLGGHMDITLEVEQTDLLSLTTQVANVGGWGWRADLRTKRVVWSNEVKRIFEVEKDYVPDWNSTFGFVKSGTRKDEIMEVVQKAAELGNSFNESFLACTAKGNDKWVRVKGMVEFKNGEATWFFGSLQDIHEEKLAELKLYQSEQLFRQIFEHSAIGMAIMDLDYRWTRVNASFCKMLGRGENEILKSHLEDITHADDIELDRRLLQELNDNKSENYQVEKKFIHKNGSTIWTLSAVSLVRKEDGEAVHFIVQLTDMTKEKLGQQHILENYQEMNSLLNATENVSIIGTDMHGVIITFNKGAENLLGFKLSEVVNKETLLRIHDKDEIGRKSEKLYNTCGQRFDGFQVLVESAKNASFQGEEWTYVSKDGSLIPVQLCLTPKKSLEGELNGFLFVAVDIGNLKVAEKKLRLLNSSVEETNRQLLRKNDELEQFAYIAAHDLQEPLRMISSFLSLFKKRYYDNLDEKGKEYINFAYDGALRMSELIKGVLKYSSTGIGNLELVDLNILVNEVVDFFLMEDTYQAAQIEVGTLPKVMANGPSIRQLFTNIVGNGLKYQVKGNVPKIKISSELKDSKWLFKIADNGIGIDPEYYGQVFQVFKRLHLKSEFSGTGIGLATCRKIIHMHGGEIWIEPNKGSGTVFCFTLKSEMDQ